MMQGGGTLSSERAQEPSAIRDGQQSTFVHLFKRAEAGQYCLSSDPTGANIPPPMNGDVWVFVRDLALTPGGCCAALEAEAVMRDLARDGFVLLGGWHDWH